MVALVVCLCGGDTAWRCNCFGRRWLCAVPQGPNVYRNKIGNIVKAPEERNILFSLNTLRSSGAGRDLFTRYPINIEPRCGQDKISFTFEQHTITPHLTLDDPDS